MTTFENQDQELSLDEFIGTDPATTITLLPDRFVTKPPLTINAKFDYLEALISNTVRNDKGELPWLKLATFNGIRNPHPSQPGSKGGFRYDDGVVAISGVEGDYDAGQVSIDEATAKLQAAGIDALLYETPSSSPAAPRWRVLCPTSITYTGSPDELKASRDVLLGRVNYVLGGILAPESFVLSQAYYFGSVAGKPPVQIRRIRGAKIDGLDYLEEIRPSPRIVERDHTSAGGPPISPDKLRELLGYIDPLCAVPGQQHGSRTPWMAIIFAIASTPLAGSAIPRGYLPGAAAFDEEAELLSIAQEWSRGELDHQGGYRNAPPATWGINNRGDAVDTDAEIERLFAQNNLDRSRTATFGTIVELAKQGGYQPATAPSEPEAFAPVQKKSGNRYLAAHKKPSEQANRPPIKYLDEAKTIACAGGLHGHRTSQQPQDRPVVEEGSRCS